MDRTPRSKYSLYPDRPPTSASDRSGANSPSPSSRRSPQFASQQQTLPHRRSSDNLKPTGSPPTTSPKGHTRARTSSFGAHRPPTAPPSGRTPSPSPRTRPAGPIEALRALITAVRVKEVQVERHGQAPIAAGGFGDVWRGVTLVEGEEVAIKVPRAVSNSHLIKLCKELARELSAWSVLHHDNVLPLLGVVISNTSPQMWLVSPWMANGSLTDYMESHPEADALHMLAGVGRGLAHVHSQRIVHGDLKANNVLVDQNGEPRLMDFGLSYDLEDPMVQTTSAMFHGNVRWLAPERLDPDRFGLSTAQSKSYASDVYALGMLSYELFSGQVPFYETRNTLALVSRIKDGERPTHPGDGARPGLTRQIWQFMGNCWQAERSYRPHAQELEPVVKHANAEIAAVMRQYRKAIQRAVEAEAALKKATYDLKIAYEDQADIKAQLSEASDDYDEVAAKLQEVKTELESRSQTVQDMYAEEVQLRTALSEETREKERYRGDSQRFQRELEQKSKELETVRGRSRLIRGSETWDKSSEYYLNLVHKLNTTIFTFSDELQKIANVKSSVVRGTTCNALIRNATGAFLLGMKDTEETIVRELQGKITDLDTRQQWLLLTRRSFSARLNAEEIDSIRLELKTSVLSDIIDIASITAPFLAAHPRFSDLMDTTCRTYVEFARTLLCDSSKFRLMYFTAHTAVDEKRMIRSAQSAPSMKEVAWTEQFGFETELEVVHLKAIVKCR